MTMNHVTFFARFCKARLGRLTFTIFLTLCAVGLAPVLAQDVKIITFDAPGADTNPGDFDGTYPSSINFWGAITGSYQDVNGTYHGFVRNPKGTIITFDAPGADINPGDFNGTTPGAINDLGMIAGSYYDANGFSHGFLRSPEGKFTSFDVPFAGGFGTIPIAINLQGAIVGYYLDANLNVHAFLRSPNGTIATWDGPEACDNGQPNGCFGSGATNINLFGIVVGGYEDNSGNFVHHSFVRTPNGKLNTFDVPSAGTGSYQGTGCPGCALGFNQLGAIAGTYIDENSVQHGFLRSSSGKFTTFDAPGAGIGAGQGTGCPSDCPTTLNDFGAITGNYIDTNYVLHGYLRRSNGTIVTVDPAGSIFTWSSSLNDVGAITGYYADENFVFHGFLAIQCNHCSENAGPATAASRISSALTTDRIGLAANHLFNPKLGSKLRFAVPSQVGK